MLTSPIDPTDLDFSLEAMAPAAPTGRMAPKGTRYHVRLGVIRVATTEDRDMANAIARKVGGSVEVA